MATLALGRQYLDVTNLEEPRLSLPAFRQLHWRGKIALAQVAALTVSCTVVPGVAWRFLQETLRNSRNGLLLLNEHLPHIVRARNGEHVQHDLGLGEPSAPAAVELALRTARQYVDLVAARIDVLSGNPQGNGPTEEQTDGHWHAAMNHLTEAVGRRRQRLGPELHQCGLTITEELLAAQALPDSPPPAPVACPPADRPPSETELHMMLYAYQAGGDVRSRDLIRAAGLTPTGGYPYELPVGLVHRGFFIRVRRGVFRIVEEGVRILRSSGWLPSG